MKLFALFSNPTTGKISHTKLWANIACAAATVKFVLIPAPEADVWFAYLGMVGGYAATRRAIAAWQQTQESQMVDDDHV